MYNQRLYMWVKGQPSLLADCNPLASLFFKQFNILDTDEVTICPRIWVSQMTKALFLSLRSPCGVR